MPSSRGSSQPRDSTRTCVSYMSCVGRWVLYWLSHEGSPNYVNPTYDVSGSLAEVLKTGAEGSVEPRHRRFPPNPSGVGQTTWSGEPCPSVQTGFPAGSVAGIPGCLPAF